MKSKTPLDTAFDAILGYEIRRLNVHLPKRRETLANLLNRREDPAIEAVDGSSILLKSSELQELAKIVPKEHQERLKLPFVVVRRMELGKSIYSLGGDRIEEFTVKKILGVTEDDYNQIYKHRDPFYLYRPQVSELLSRFHSLVLIGFGLPRELRDYSPNRV